MYYKFNNMIDAMAFLHQYNTEREDNLAKFVAWPYANNENNFILFCPKKLEKNHG